jgi:DNA-binding transcriptional ArsR family regulator
MAAFPLLAFVGRLGCPPSNVRLTFLPQTSRFDKHFSFNYIDAVSDAALFSAIASPRRREILRLVWDRELQAGAVHAAMPDVTFGAVSLQLRTLMRAGLVSVRAEGRERFYRARREVLGPVGEMLEGMWSDALWRLKLQAELDQTRRGPRQRRRRPKGRR